MQNETNKKFSEQGSLFPFVNFIQPTMHSDDWNRIVFAKHHQDYGAFQLRSNYGQQLGKSFFISIAIIFLSIHLAFFMNRDSPIYNAGKSTEYIIPENIKFEKLDTEKKKMVQESKPKKNSATIITSDSSLNKNPVVKELPDSGFGSGTDTSGIFKPVVKGSIGGGKSTGSKTTESEKDSVVTWAPEMPEFPGGIKALNKYISKNLKTNNQWRESGNAGKIIYEFVIDRDGKITNLKVIMDNVKYGIAELNMTMMNDMPNWKPGKNNGHEVRVLFRLPVLLMKE